MSDVPCSFLLPLSDEMEQHQSPQSSMLSSSENDFAFTRITRIYHSEGKTDSPLISPCHCSGSLCYVHNSCLQKWIKRSGTNCCEICKFQYVMETKFLPFWKVLIEFNVFPFLNTYSIFTILNTTLCLVYVMFNYLAYVVF